MTSTKYAPKFDNEEVPAPISIWEFPLESYIISSPFTKLWSDEKVIIFVDVLIPPPLPEDTALNETLLVFLTKTGSMEAPVPLPPEILIDTILSMSKSWESTYTSSIPPLTTGWIFAAVPDVFGEVMRGGLMTSYPSPAFRTSTEDNGP